MRAKSCFFGILVAAVPLWSGSGSEESSSALVALGTCMHKLGQPYKTEGSPPDRLRWSGPDGTTDLFVTGERVEIALIVDTAGKRKSVTPEEVMKIHSWICPEAEWNEKRRFVEGNVAVTEYVTLDGRFDCQVRILSVSGAWQDCILIRELNSRHAKTEEEGQPGATDNPDDAQRLREDH